MSIRTGLVFLALIGTASGCARDKAPVTPDSAPDSGAHASASPTQQEAVGKAAEANQGGGLGFSADVLRLCPGVQVPRFGFDSAELRKSWADALGTLGACMKTGGLKGSSLVLTGHTDARGNDD